MKKGRADVRTRLQLQGIIFILFGMLLVLVAVVNDNWVPMMPQGIGSVFSFGLVWLGLIMGILGVALSLSKISDDK